MISVHRAALRRTVRTHDGRYKVKLFSVIVAIDDLTLIGEHAKTQWRAGAFRLERRFPADHNT